eukprot:105636-Hanusia_phi.AAC.1
MVTRTLGGNKYAGKLAGTEVDPVANPPPPGTALPLTPLEPPADPIELVGKPGDAEELGYAEEGGGEGEGGGGSGGGGEGEGGREGGGRGGGGGGGGSGGGGGGGSGGGGGGGAPKGVYPEK